MKFIGYYQNDLIQEKNAMLYGLNENNERFLEYHGDISQGLFHGIGRVYLDHNTLYFAGEFVEGKPADGMIGSEKSLFIEQEQDQNTDARMMSISSIQKTENENNDGMNSLEIELKNEENFVKKKVVRQEEGMVLDGEGSAVGRELGSEESGRKEHSFKIVDKGGDGSGLEEGGAGSD